MSEATQVTDQGWAWIHWLSRKAHYYDGDGRSLCRNFGSFGVPVRGGLDYCPDCRS